MNAARTLVALGAAGLHAAASLAAADHAGHHDHDEPRAGMPMQSAIGPYPMSRQASGTGWQPDAAPVDGLHATRGAWSLMGHGFVNWVHDRQGGPRGGTKDFAQSMAMLMAQRPAGPGTLGLRAMVSLDPTIGAGGYPLLFQTGETADGRTPLVDRQHPHDALMELAASYGVRLGRDGAAFAYVGLPGEPALGPPTFMHRFSAMRNPEAPLAHHRLDATHITFGVVTLGASLGAWKVEASSFNGREPDQVRWNVETRSFDSWSARLSYNPLPALALQASTADLRRPERLEPDTRVRRRTASAVLHLKPGGHDWGTTLAWGRNDASGPHGRVQLPAWLLESTAVVGRHTVFGRAESLRNDELFAEGDALHGPAWRVRKLSLGYVFDVAKTGPAAWGLGISGSAYRIPAAIEPAYGASPRSWMVFVQGRI